MFVLMLSFGIAGNAQSITSGTVDFSISVAEAFDIRGNGVATTNDPGITGSTPQIPNNALGMVLTVLDASPNVNNAVLTANIPFRLRSNRTYQLTATRLNSTTANAQDFDASDIGMGISFNARSGARVNTGGSDAPATGWQVGGGNHVALLGLSGIQIATGSRISNQGNNTSSDNFITGNLNFTIARQYYTPTVTPFAEQVQVAISAAP